MWDFERLAVGAEQMAKVGDLQAAADNWEQAVALHGELGLLPDEGWLPLATVEPERERLRQQWLRGVRWLARHEATAGSIERAATLWETVWRAAPLDREAYGWLAAHYRQTGQTAQLAALQDARLRMERKWAERRLRKLIRNAALLCWDGYVAGARWRGPPAASQQRSHPR